MGVIEHNENFVVTFEAPYDKRLWIGLDDALEREGGACSAAQHGEAGQHARSDCSKNGVEKTSEKCCDMYTGHEDISAC